MQEEEYHVA